MNIFNEHRLGDNNLVISPSFIQFVTDTVKTTRQNAETVKTICLSRPAKE